MDDEEYYKKIREQYQHKTHKIVNKKFDFTRWNAQQGREDAEMLEEKQNNSNQQQDN